MFHIVVAFFTLEFKYCINFNGVKFGQIMPLLHLNYIIKVKH